MFSVGSWFGECCSAFSCRLRRWSLICVMLTGKNSFDNGSNNNNNQKSSLLVVLYLENAALGAVLYKNIMCVCMRCKIWPFIWPDSQNNACWNSCSSHVHACGYSMCSHCCRVNSRNQLLRACLLLNVKLSALWVQKDYFLQEGWGRWRLISNQYLIDKLSVHLCSLLGFCGITNICRMEGEC